MALIPDVWRPSHISATGTAVVHDGAALLQGKDDRDCMGVRNWPAEAQHTEKAVTKEGEKSLKGILILICLRIVHCSVL